MTEKEIQIRDLTLLLKDLDSNLLQRATDYIRGLIDASSEQKHDWWDELPDSVKQDYDEGLKEMEQGKEVDVEDFLKKYIRK